MGESKDTTDRRTFLKAAGVGAATSVVLAGGGAAHDQDSLDSQLAEVKEATAKYADPQAALDDGYQIMGPFVPGMGWHFINPGNVGAAVENDFSLTVPQLLTYGDTGEGLDGLVLGSVEYAIPVGERDYTQENVPDLFTDTDGSEQWHVHPSAEHAFIAEMNPSSEEFPETMADVPTGELLRSSNWIEFVPGGTRDQTMLESGTTVVADFSGGRGLDQRAVVNSSVHPDLLTLHAWVHHDNPDGVFTGANPDLPNEPSQ